MTINKKALKFVGLFWLTLFLLSAYMYGSVWLSMKLGGLWPMLILSLPLVFGVSYLIYDADVDSQKVSNPPIGELRPPRG